MTMDRHSNKSKGYGFVTFRYAANAAAAVVEQEKQIDVSTFAQLPTARAIEACLSKVVNIEKNKPMLLIVDCANFSTARLEYVDGILDSYMV